MTRARLPQFTRDDLDAIHDALQFILAGEIDAETDADAERKREAYERASGKVVARLNAIAERARR